ncbi:hypothetical protein [Sinomonas halotolerans]|uniref:Sugar ABC transporter ATPase n=1 Tax=Sinomonas halotolerans TaxID=1644133 RepID=A0ABU9WYX4_9MICC
MTDEVPEADAVEQSIPAGPGGPDEPVAGTPLEASEADVLEQRTSALPGGGGPLSEAGAEANEADLLEQAEGLPGDDEDYPPAGTAEYED